jgi:hypothetical protein
LTWKLLRKAHNKLKRTRHRGDPVTYALATEVYLRRLEEELDHVRDLLGEARAKGEMHKADQAQQRLHRVIKKQARRDKSKHEKG